MLTVSIGQLLLLRLYAGLEVLGLSPSCSDAILDVRHLLLWSGECVAQLNGFGGEDVSERERVSRRWLDIPLVQLRCSVAE